MLKSDVIRYFGGTQVAVARALGIGKQAVNKWPDLVPRPWAAELHVRSNGALHFDPLIYQAPPLVFEDDFVAVPLARAA
jgi:hypothetical protein